MTTQLFFVISFSFVIVQAPSLKALAAPQCSQVFHNDLKQSEGLLENLVQHLKDDMREASIRLNQELVRLKSGGPDWRPVEPELVQEIEKQVREYNQDFGEANTPRKQNALLRIQQLLRQSKTFSSLSSDQRDRLAMTLVKPDLIPEMTSYGTEHILNLFRGAFKLLPTSGLNDLTNHFVAIQSVGKKYRQLESDLAASQFFLNDKEYRNLTLDSLEELLSKRLKNKNALVQKISLPVHIEKAWIESAKNYTNAEKNSPGNSNSGMVLATEQFMALLSDPYFSQFSRSFLRDSLPFTFMLITQPDLGAIRAGFKAREMLAEELKNPDIIKLKRQLKQIDEIQEMLLRY